MFRLEFSLLSKKRPKTNFKHFLIPNFNLSEEMDNAVTKEGQF